MPKASHTDSIDMCRVDAIVRRDTPCSRSSIMSFALVFLAMARTLFVQPTLAWRDYFTKGVRGRYGCRETGATQNAQ